MEYVVIFNSRFIATSSVFCSFVDRCISAYLDSSVAIAGIHDHHKRFPASFDWYTYTFWCPLAFNWRSYNFIHMKMYRWSIDFESVQKLPLGIFTPQKIRGLILFRFMLGRYERWREDFLIQTTHTKNANQISPVQYDYDKTGIYQTKRGLNWKPFHQFSGEHTNWQNIINEMVIVNS